MPLPAPASTLVDAAPRLATEAVPHGALLVYSLPARDGDGQMVGLVVVTASLHEVQATTQAMLALLVAGGLGVVFLAILGSGVLVQRGLRPLEEMASVAEGITAASGRCLARESSRARRPAATRRHTANAVASLGTQATRKSLCGARS